MKLADQAKNRWAAILPGCGVSKDFLTGRHGPCPICDGKDRFRFDDKGKGLWYCNQCGAGDGVSLVMKVNSWSFKEAAREIEKHIGTAPVVVRLGPDPAKVKAETNDIWRGGIPLTAMPATCAWWTKRVGIVPELKDVRAVRSLDYPGSHPYPGMVALVRGADGLAVNMHRTYLTNDGEKAPVSEARRVMPMPLPAGCAVRLAPYQDALGIAEGIETAAAVSILFGVPCWAALNAQNMMGWVPPDGVRVMVYGDNDASFTGHAAAYTLGRKLKAKSLDVTVHIPPDRGTDWNDVLIDRLAKGLDPRIAPPSLETRPKERAA